jgi:hypothetical protein
MSEPESLTVFWMKVFRFARRRKFVRSVLLPLVFCGCGSAAAPLSIELYNPETNQVLTCAARGELPQANSTVLAAVVESCAKQLESRGFVRKN